MPIEFACEACHQLLRVPDGSQGQSCQCPACQQMLVIPDRESKARSEKGSGGPAQAETLKIPCPTCHFELVCPATLLGTKGQCRNCQTVFTIGEKKSAAPADSHAAATGFIFNCPKCQQLFEGQAEMQGRKGKCHACGAVFAIDLKPAKPTPAAKPNPATKHTPATSPSAAASSHHAPAATPTPQRTSAVKPVSQTATNRTPPASIQFACTQCQGVMEVPAATAGRTTECPFCQQRLTIPLRSTEDTTARASTSEYFVPHAPADPQVFPPDRTVNLGRESSSAGPAASSGGLGINPYAAPAPDPYATLNAADEWSQAAGRKKIRGLTFGNAFELTFSSLFPYCLVAAAAFTLVAGLAFGLVTASAVLAGFAVQTFQLEPKSTEAMTVIYGLVGVAVIVAVFLVTAVYCMTCNTALHVVRGKKITGEVLFGTGESYGGMLAVMFGWTGFNLVRKFGIPLITQGLVDAGQRDTAVVVALVALGLLFVLQSALLLLLAYVPYALLDGQSLPDAIATSSSIALNNFLIVLAVNFCGGLLYVLVSVLTCGVGLIVFIGGLLYLNAAVYHLAEK